MTKLSNTIVLYALVAFSVSAGFGQQREEPDKQRVGGCSLDTVAVGTSFRRANPPSSAAWIKVHSIEFAGEDIYRDAVRQVSSALDSAGIAVFSCSELVHIEEGPCWPPYTVTLRIDTRKKEETARLRQLLELNSPGGLAHSKERPPGYGVLFITCGRYAVDWWTVWYRDNSGKE
ncbi:MAG: hypothetical protein GF417_07830 [Candidatus Latescibacteria bacterium]|nr:hypothetical protein [bacterium]MBD3424329.1 hypothetical protein [Candidatus Latescibacterota bacterium]